jgi:starch phosphorylase
MATETPLQSSLSDAHVSRLSRRMLRVLIVEDSANDAELMAYELKKYGLSFTWDRVATEAEFVAELSQRVDLVLADYHVPGFGAVRALEILQERALSIPLVVVSGTIGEEAAASIVKCGATDYVLKSQLALLGGRAARALQGLRKIAYFSMEIALESDISTYSGGLGILAGDTIRSAADLQVPMVAVSLIHRMGYFRQQLDARGWQTEQPAQWPVEDLLDKLPVSISVKLEARTVHLYIWKYDVKGVTGYVVPVYLLDSNVPENSEWDRNLTNQLYGGDWYYRICQEIVLGVGGVEALRRLGYDRIERYHMNEGHASLLTIALLQEQARRAGRDQVNINDLAAVRHKCIFTTHTPVPAGHDQFPLNALSRLLWCRDDPLKTFTSETALHVFGKRAPNEDNQSDHQIDTTVNLTFLALNLSRYVNGVAKKHGEISQMMFAGYQVDAITNGVHVNTWACPSIQALFDRYIPDWRQDNFSLRYAASIPCGEIREAHRAAKKELAAFVNQREHGRMSEDVFTIGFARRATAYKRPDLLFTDLDRLRKAGRSFGRLQIVFSGKAHPRDNDGKVLIKKIFEMKEQLEDDVIISFIENYDMDIAKRIVAGVDLWLNTPRPPMEASGTSGMKAAINGVPSLSILDGWWLEGHIEGVTGWSIVEEKRNQEDDETSGSAACLYRKLEDEIMPLFYERPDQFARIMQYAIALNGSFFNTQRMLQQYVLRAYFP